MSVYLRAIQGLEKWKIKFCGDGPLRKRAEEYGQVTGMVKDLMSHILGARFVFTSGYLAILEAMVSKRLVFAVYDNPLKKDYLKMAGFAKWIIIVKSGGELVKKVDYYFTHPEKEEKLVNGGYNWASKQKWEKVVKMYEKLWQK